MLFGHPPFDITFYRGPTGVGEFRPIPGYALTRTWERTPTPGSKTVAIKLNATDIEIPVFWQVGDLELGTYDCGPLVGYIVKGQIIPAKANRLLQSAKLHTERPHPVQSIRMERPATNRPIRSKEDMDVHSRTRNPRSSQMDRRQNNTTMATNIRDSPNQTTT
jgi:hypothetical protein